MTIDYKWSRENKSQNESEKFKELRSKLKRNQVGRTISGTLTGIGLVVAVMTVSTSDYSELTGAPMSIGKLIAYAGTGVVMMAIGALLNVYFDENVNKATKALNKRAGVSDLEGRVVHLFKDRNGNPFKFTDTEDKSN